MARQCYCVFLIFFLKLVLGLCDDSSEEAAPKEVLGDEYEQIFHSIPTLFEYLLEILEERPEILEKDDVTFFHELPQEACEGDDKRKREAQEQCDDKIAMGDDHFEAFKRNIVKNYFTHAKDTMGGDRSIDEFLTQIPDITVIPDTTMIPDVTKIPEITVISDTTVIPIITVIPDTTEIPETIVIPDTTQIPHIKPRARRNGSNNKVLKKVKSEFNNSNDKSKINKSERKQNVIVKKRNVASESFIGSIDWSKFNLSPEDVEEQALKTEQALEDHNKKERLHQ